MIILVFIAIFITFVVCSECDERQLRRRCIRLCGSTERVKVCPETCDEAKRIAMECKQLPLPTLFERVQKGVAMWLDDVIFSISETFFSASGKDVDDQSSSSHAASNRRTSKTSKTTTATTTTSLPSSEPMLELDWPTHASPAERLRIITEQLLDKRVPTMIRNIQELDSALFWHWTPSNLARRSAATLTAKSKSTPTDSEFSVGCCEVTPLTMSEFWFAVDDEEDLPHWYMSTKLEALGDTFRDDFPPNFDFLPTATHGEQVMRYIWTVSDNATTPLHYDPYENVFVQVFGAKRFELYPPDYAHAMYLHPKVHVAHRQAQIRRWPMPKDVDEKKFPRARKVFEASSMPALARTPRHSSSTSSATAAATYHHYPLIVTVEPGDILYLPSHWFHRVTSIGKSISFNHWYPSETSKRLSRAWDVPPAINRQWSVYQKTMALRATIMYLVESLYGENTFVDVVKELLETRYVPLYGKGDDDDEQAQEVDVLKGVGSRKDPHCLQHMTELNDLRSHQIIPSSVSVDMFCAPPSANEDVDVDSVLLEVYTEGFKSQVAHLSEPFLSSSMEEGGGGGGGGGVLGVASRRAKPVDAAIANIVVEDLIEDVVAQVVGDERVYVYLRKCVLVEPALIYGKRVKRVDDDYFRRLRRVVISSVAPPDEEESTPLDEAKGVKSEL